MVATILRLWDLGGTPIHLTSDEVALGYNAYSIIKTAKDEHGVLLPIIFESFHDFKPGLYVYVTAPFVALFGLNEFTTRLPGAISGIVAVWLLYLVVGELFKEKKSLQIFSALLLAISPWHIHFSRGAWEAGISLTLTLAGIYFFLRSIKDKPRWFILSALFFGLTLITYQGAKLSSGIVVLGLIISYVKQLLLISKKTIFISVVVGIIVSSPVLLSFGTEKTGRLEVFSIFSYPRPQGVVDHILSQGEETNISLTYLLFHSEQLHFVKGILSRWINHYSPRFLFFEGDWSHHNLSVPRIGAILFIDIVFLIAGIVVLARTRFNPAVFFIGYWFLIAPLPAALSRDSINAIRSLNLVLPLTIMLALGATFIWEKVGLKRVFVFVFLSLYIANFIFFIEGYFVHMNVRSAKYWQYGYKQVVEKVTEVQKNYHQIIFVQSYDQPYIFFLFYQKYDPSLYQSKVHLVASHNPLDVGFVEKLDNINFELIDWPSHRGRSGALFIGNTEQIPPVDSNDPNKFKLLDEIKYPNGEIVFRIVEVL